MADLQEQFTLSTNKNLLQPTKYQLVLPRFPNVTYWCRDVQLPGISIGAPTQPTLHVDRPTPGNKLVYAPLTLQFQVDELLMNWIEIHNWLRGLGMPTSFKERLSLQNQTTNVRNDYSDAIVLILSAKNNATYEVHYKDCFPVELTPIQWSASSDANEILTATVTFRYFYYNITRLNNDTINVSPITFPNTSNADH
jgi:hypothetical protein